VLHKKYQIVSQSHLVVKTTVFFQREFRVARGTRAMSACNFSGGNIICVRLLWRQPIFGNPVEPVHKLSTSKVAINIYRIIQLGTSNWLVIRNDNTKDTCCTLPLYDSSTVNTNRSEEIQV
jgi:hypothetical protein